MNINEFGLRMPAGRAKAKWPRVCALSAAAVIGGVITSTLLTLLVIPTLYEVLSGLRDRVTRRSRRNLHEAEPAHAEE